MPLLAASAGCEQPISGGPPVNLQQYQHMRKEGPSGYPDATILIINRARFVDQDLPLPQRLESLAVVDKLGGRDPQVRLEYASVLSAAGTPQPLQTALVDLLLATDDAEVGGILAQSLPQLAPSGPQAVKILEWLGKHPSAGVVGGIVKLWATKTGREDDGRYIELIRKLSGKAWDQAILDAINDPSFSAPAAAIEVLARRIEAPTLGARIAQMAPRADALRTLREFFVQFEYLPGSQGEFQRIALLYEDHYKSLADGGKEYRLWAADGYRFSLDDLPLLVSLGGDPLRPVIPRRQLVQELKVCLGAREHVRWAKLTTTLPADGKRPAAEDRFDANIDKLTMADLWNLYLLQEMLSRPRIEAALHVVADKDREDRSSAWGGLVFYKSGSADAMLYRAASEGRDDLTYLPSPKALGDRQQALCMFSCRFDKPDNSPRAGPDDRDLREAANGNYYGLILTGVNGGNFCAHYYNPQGLVVSLGVYRFGELK
jgi:hypothetical protein